MTTATLDNLQFGMSVDISGRVFDIPKTKIELDDWKLRELWCKGIINDLSYIIFALELESKANFNIDSFIRKWECLDLSEQQADDGWKKKNLKLRSVLNTIAILDEKSIISANLTASISQLTLYKQKKGLLGCDFNIKIQQLSLFE